MKPSTSPAPRNNFFTWISPKHFLLFAAPNRATIAPLPNEVYSDTFQRTEDKVQA